MGSKGSQNSQTAQAQTYAPTGAGYIQNALQQGQSAAQLPFNIPQAPVAGFSPQQQQAFGLVGQAQGQAQPYYNQAQNYFQQSTQPNVSQFFNPLAGAVTSQLGNIFGQQASQNTGQLTQAAGGVGADRIAVGQSELANQQGLAAGQTLAGLYTPALGAAQQQESLLQGAGYGTASLGSQAENTALTGAQALLGTGGLQQQLQQAQLNAPYQQQLAQAAFPYQQAQFNAGITGALAPGLGGTTTGQGQTTSQYNPSLMSQILGGAGIGTALGGYFGGSGKGTNAYGGGSAAAGDAYGGSAAAPIAPWMTSEDYGARGGAFARGGSASPFVFDTGGVIPFPISQDQRDQTYQMLKGRNESPTLRPGTLGPKAPVIPIKAMGGATNPFAFAAGGSPYSLPSGINDDPINVDQESVIPQENLQPAQVHMPNLNLSPPAQSQSNSGSGVGQAIGDIAKIATLFANRGGTVNQPFQTFDAGGTPDTTPALFGDRFPASTTLAGVTGIPPSSPLGAADAWPSGTPFNPYRTTPPADMQAWRDGTSATPDATADSTSPPGAAPTAGAGMSPGAPAPPPSPGATTSDDSGPSLGGFLKSPYAALLQAGLSAFTPAGFAGGFAQGEKTYQGQQTIDESAKRLAQEAKFHEDQFTRSTPYQQFEMQKPQQIGRNLYGQPVFGVLDPKTGTYVDPVTHKPVDTSQMGEADDAMIQSTAKAIANYDQPPISPYKAVTPIGMAIMNKAREINPQYDTKNYGEANSAKTKFGSGPQGDAVRSFGTAYRHIDLAERMIDAMNNGDSKLVNTLRNEWKTVFGTSAAPNNFEAAKSIVSDEIMKAVLGARGALGDRTDAQKHLDAATSPKLLHSVIEDTYKPLMIGQLQGYKHQYEGATHGAKDFNEKLSPEVSQDLDKAEAAAAARAQAAQANPAAPAGGGAAAPSVGTRKQFKQGWGVWDGSKWVPEKP
jgi:hypothetical protein